MNNNTPIIAKAYMSRSLITHKATCRNAFRRPNGDLWVALTGDTYLEIWRSQDNGFSWHIANPDVATAVDFNSSASFNANGPHPCMFISEKWNLVRFIFADYPGTGTDSDIESTMYTLDPEYPSIAAFDWTINSTPDTASAADIALAVHFGYFQGIMGTNNFYIIYEDANDLQLKLISPQSTAISSVKTLTYTPTVIGMMNGVASEDENIDIIFEEQNADTHSYVTHTRYNVKANTYTTPNHVLDLGLASTYDAVSIDIARDIYGTLCAVWSKVNFAANTSCVIYYSISKNNGVTWTNVALDRTTGHGYYTDAIMSAVDGRTTVMGGSNGGFIMSYCEDNQGAIPKTFVRLITTSDGVTYTLGDEKEIGTSNTTSGEAVVGAHFFIPINHELMDLSDPGQVRVCYQVGEGDSSVQYDNKPVAIKQELLSLSAYPSVNVIDSSTYTQDTADSQSMLVTFNLVGAPSNNVDFNALNLTGKFTERYHAAFEKVGTTIRLEQFEPKSTNYMNDSSAYDSPTTHFIKCVFQPQSYSNPLRNLSTSDAQDFIEQDIRKIYLPPDMHLSRTFLVNNGGYLKRTVWLCEFDGNRYELSQVVPRFINNQICYYEANAYVVGPSRDPFSRTILPSET
jgi:hypothetical protein